MISLLAARAALTRALRIRAFRDSRGFLDARAKTRELEGRSVDPRPEVRETNAPKKARRKRPSREVLVNALGQAGGNQAAAGRLLDVPERQIMRWMDAYQIPRAQKKKRTE